MRPSRFQIALVTVTLLGALSEPVQAQLEEQPGYFPIDQFELLSPEALSLEINLNGALLELVASALDSEDPEFSELVRGLEGIRVRVAEAGDLDLAALRSEFSRAAGWLEENGWDTLVRLREDDEELYVYTRLLDGDMVGMTLLVLEPVEQVVVVNVVGTLDLALLASLADSLDIPQLDVAGLGSEETEGDSESEEE